MCLPSGSATLFGVCPLVVSSDKFQRPSFASLPPGVFALNSDCMDSVYHLRHDAIYETDLSHEEAKAWTQLSPQVKLLDRYREKFRAIGYEFGGSILNVLRCPACPKDAKPDADKAALKAGIVELLGDDEEGIAATMEDFGL